MDKVRKISYFKISNLIFKELPVGGINFFFACATGWEKPAFLFQFTSCITIK